MYTITTNISNEINNYSFSLAWVWIIVPYSERSKLHMSETSRSVRSRSEVRDREISYRRKFTSHVTPTLQGEVIYTAEGELELSNFHILEMCEWLITTEMMKGAKGIKSGWGR